jgi:hypothetical protein
MGKAEGSLEPVVVDNLLPELIYFAFFPGYLYLAFVPDRNARRIIATVLKPLKGI